MNNSVKLGLFTALGIAAIIGSIIALGDISISRQIKVYVLFDNVTGITQKARVRIAGVNVGFLNGAQLQGKRARLTLAINRDIKIYKNAKASIASTGMIGAKYIEIYPGDDSFPLVKNGDTIESSAAASLNDILDNLAKSLDADRISNIFEGLADSVNNVKNITQAIASQTQEIKMIIDNFYAVSSDMASITKDNKEDIRVAIANMKDISDKLDEIILNVYNGQGFAGALLADEQVGEDLKQTIASAKETMQGIQDIIGSAGKLQMQWEYMGYYNTESQKYKNDLGIRIMPNNTKFYYVGVSNMGDTKSAKTDEEKDEMNKIDALLGFRFNKFEVYAGLMRTSGGIGIGYSFFEPIYADRRTLQAHLRAYNFGREDKGARIDADLRIGILKWLYAGVMVEDAMYRAGFTPYIKVEIKDKDLASLFGIAGVAAAASK
ncbi:MAG: MlaD family protein [Elusimicrobiota bacterium]|jgi:phospholipid/cholesterol/gamma-HCH transport system substrate-binding protein|nr:MlaD family protein [Elusimicrobiota bacterium]